MYLRQFSFSLHVKEGFIQIFKINFNAFKHTAIYVKLSSCVIAPLNGLLRFRKYTFRNSQKKVYLTYNFIYR